MDEVVNGRRLRELVDQGTVRSVILREEVTIGEHVISYEEVVNAELYLNDQTFRDYWDEKMRTVIGRMIMRKLNPVLTMRIGSKNFFE